MCKLNCVNVIIYILNIFLSLPLLVLAYISPSSNLSHKFVSLQKIKNPTAYLLGRASVY